MPSHHVTSGVPNLKSSGVPPLCPTLCAPRAWGRGARARHMHKHHGAERLHHASSPANSKARARFPGELLRQSPWGAEIGLAIARRSPGPGAAQRTPPKTPCTWQLCARAALLPMTVRVAYDCACVVSCGACPVSCGITCCVSLCARGLHRAWYFRITRGVGVHSARGNTRYLY